MEKDGIRTQIASKIDRLQNEIENEKQFDKRMLLRDQSKVLFTALIALNHIQYKIINLTSASEKLDRML